MKKVICILAALALLAVLPLGVLAAEDVQSMIDGLPSVEEFQAMDSDRQQVVYNQTQAAYDAYIALSEAEQAAITGAEETFEALFGCFNSMVMPLEAVTEEPAEEASSTGENLLSTALAAGLVIFVLRAFGKKKR